MRRTIYMAVFILALISVYYSARWFFDGREETANLSASTQNRMHISSWVRNGEPADLDRLVKLIGVIGRREIEQFPPDFPIIGHRIVRGKGDILLTRLFIRKTNTLAGAAVSHERLTIYLPDGLPEKGKKVLIGNGGERGPIAIRSRGSGLNPSATCFGYASHGVVGVAGTLPQGSVDTAVSGNIYAPNHRDIEAGVSEVVIHLSLEFDMYRMTSDGAVACALPGTENSGIATNRYGVTDTYVFNLKQIATLPPYEGNIVGPLTKVEFGPRWLVDDQPMVRGHYNY